MMTLLFALDLNVLQKIAAARLEGLVDLAILLLSLLMLVSQRLLELFALGLHRRWLNLWIVSSYISTYLSVQVLRTAGYLWLLYL